MQFRDKPRQGEHTPSPPTRLPLLRKRLTIAGLAHRTVAPRYIGPAAAGLLLAGLWRVGDLVSDGAVCLALSLLCGGLWRGVVGRVRAARRKNRSPIEAQISRGFGPEIVASNWIARLVCLARSIALQWVLALLGCLKVQAGYRAEMEDRRPLIMERVQLSRTTSRQHSGGLAVNFPNSVLIAAREDPVHFQRRVLVQTLGSLYAQGKLSSGLAAQVLGCDRWEFYRLLTEYGFSVLDYAEDELAYEANTSRELAARITRP